jgi:hypothetical protein
MPSSTILSAPALPVVVVVGKGAVGSGTAGVLGVDSGVVARPLGITTLEGLDSELLPNLLSATTVNSYRPPLVSPEISHCAPLATQVLFSGCDVTTYRLIGEPPFDLGADHFTTARALPAVARTARTAVGTECFGAADVGKENANENARELLATIATLIQRACAKIRKSMFSSVVREAIYLLSCRPVFLNRFRTDLQEC